MRDGSELNTSVFDVNTGTGKVYIDKEQLTDGFYELMVTVVNKEGDSYSYKFDVTSHSYIVV